MRNRRHASAFGVASAAVPLRTVAIARAPRDRRSVSARRRRWRSCSPIVETIQALCGSRCAVAKSNVNVKATAARAFVTNLNRHQQSRFFSSDLSSVRTLYNFTSKLLYPTGPTNACAPKSPQDAPGAGDEFVSPLGRQQELLDGKRRPRTAQPAFGTHLAATPRALTGASGARGGETRRALVDNVGRRTPAQSRLKNFVRFGAIGTCRLKNFVRFAAINSPAQSAVRPPKPSPQGRSPHPLHLPLVDSAHPCLPTPTQ